ncbi:MAG: amino acid ABC transporter permease [Dermatophilaceae bacterium]
MSAPSVLFDAPGPRARARHRAFTALALLAAAGLLWVVLRRFEESGQLDGEMWGRVVQREAWTAYVIPGIVKTLQAAALSIVLAIVFGLVFGVGRLSQVAPVRWVCGVVVEFFRAVPVLLMMFFLFAVYTRENLFGRDFNSFYAVVTALTLYNGSVIAELVRSGVYQLPKGQGEAGLSIGLTRGQTLRSIELPQALTAMLPALVGQLVVVLKDTALGTAITYPELLQEARNLGTAYAAVIPAYVLAAVLFILLNYGLTLLANRVERRLNRRGRTAGPVAHTTGPGPGSLAVAAAAPGAGERPHDRPPPPFSGGGGVGSAGAAGPF